MSGVKGRSGPPGNLNCAKRPWRSFWKRRALRPEDKWITPVLEDYAADLATDKADAMTGGELHLAEVATIARGCSMLILAEARKAGFIRQTAEGWDLHPGAKELSRFLTLEKAALLGLGLERRQRHIDPRERLLMAMQKPTS